MCFNPRRNRCPHAPVIDTSVEVGVGNRLRYVLKMPVGTSPRRAKATRYAPSPAQNQRRTLQQGRLSPPDGAGAGATDRATRPSSYGGNRVSESENRLRLQPHLRQPVAQRIPGQAQQARGLALVSVRPPQRLADQVLLVLIQLMPSGRKCESLCARVAAARSPADILRIQFLTGAITRLRSITFSSSRTLPGQW